MWADSRNCTTQERDLGVVVSKDTDWGEHISSSVVSKANRMLGFLKRHCENILDAYP